MNLNTRAVPDDAIIEAAYPDVSADNRERYKGIVAKYLQAQEDMVTELVNGPIRINLTCHEVTINGNIVVFTNREYTLLEFFMRNISKVIESKHILACVWGPANVEDMPYLRVYLAQVREIFEKHLPGITVFVTYRGIGYMMPKL